MSASAGRDSSLIWRHVSPSQLGGKVGKISCSFLEPHSWELGGHWKGRFEDWRSLKWLHLLKKYFFHVLGILNFFFALFILQKWQRLGGFSFHLGAFIYHSWRIRISNSSIHLLSHDRFFMTPWTAAHQASLSITNPQSLLKLLCIEPVMPSNHLILCHPLLLLLSIFPSIRVFSNESVFHIRWPKYWSFSFSISPSNEYSGLISFRIDWFDLLATKGLSRIFSNTIVQNINSLALSFHYTPTLTSIYVYWKKI